MIADIIMDVYELRWSVRGYHVYREIWEAALDEVLTCVRETENARDRYAVAVVKNNENVGHVPRKISKICSLFLTFQEASITCTVTGGRQYSGDLPQGGQEIPCLYTFCGKREDVVKLGSFLKDYDYMQNSQE